MRQHILLVLVSLGILLAQSVSAGAIESDQPRPTTETQDVLSDLHGLEFDEFLDASYIQILLRSPELVTGMGLSEFVGIGDGELDNICYSYVDESYQLKVGILALLESYDRSGLTYDQKISYDSYSWLLEDWAEEHQFMYHFYPVTPRFSRQIDLIRLFANEHPLETRQNAEDYIARLSQVDDQIACLIGNLDESEALGIVAPADLLWHAADEIRFIEPGNATELPFYTGLADRIGGIPGLTPADRRDLLDRAEEAVDNSVIPGYQALIANLDEQKLEAPPMNGVWQLPDGDAFYLSRLRHHTTTEMSPGEVFQFGLVEVENVQDQIRAAADALGYPADLSMEEIFQRVAVDGGTVPADQYRAVTEGIVRKAERDIAQVFDIAPKTEVVVITGQGGMFYIPGSMDGSRPGAYYAGREHDADRYWMQDTAYHEAVPGHHFQISIGNELDLPLFTNQGSFYTAYVEGWALYAEFLAGELGWYFDVYCELGRLQAELMRAVRLVLDTGIHERRWTNDQATSYYQRMVGAGPNQAWGQVELYTFFPGYFSSYKIGMHKILEVRQRAMDELGDRFDIKAFHRAVLTHNRLPLPLLERLIDDFIVEEIERHTPRQTGGRRSPTP